MSRIRWRMRGVVLRAAACLALLALPGVTLAQGIRGSATATLRYIELRPIRQDTVSRERVTELPDGRLEFEGIPVSCVTGLPCVFYRSGAVEHTVVGTQDVSFTAWGLGVQGLSATALLRARGDIGGDFVWPRADDHFDAILAYAELNRGLVRARLGRQRTTSGLGFNGYDGASVVVSPRAWLDIEGYGGMSLARGLAEWREDALEGLEEFVLDSLNSFLVGASVRAEPRPGLAVTARYQRDFLESRGGLVSERASLDVSTSQFRTLMFDAAVDYDFAFGRIGKAHATVRAPLRRGLTLEATARRYLPYFELITIWGLFSPVGYHEVEGRTTWRATPRLTGWLSGGWRRYQEANATVIFRPIEQDGIRAGAGVIWRAGESIAADASYRIEHGFGAFLNSGQASVEWRPSDRLGVSLEGAAFQQIAQFRVGEGIVYGAGGSADVRLRDYLLLTTGAMLYRQNFENRPGLADWNQVRAWTIVRVSFGRDPGAEKLRPRGTP